MIRMSNELKRELIAELRREIRAAQSAVAAVDNAVAERLGVNATDHRCLDILDQRGAMTAGAVAEALGLSRSAVTTVLDRLEQRRYVRRLQNPDDRRQVVVALTPQLRRRARQLYGDDSEVVAILGRYSVDDLALLRDFLRSDREHNEDRARRLAGRGPTRDGDPQRVTPACSPVRPERRQ
jgi:DNA-binding MarR family transcriptional regulator